MTPIIIIYTPAGEAAFGAIETHEREEPPQIITLAPKDYTEETPPSAASALPVGVV